MEDLFCLLAVLLEPSFHSLLLKAFLCLPSRLPSSLEVPEHNQTSLRGSLGERENMPELLHGAEKVS